MTVSAVVPIRYRDCFDDQGEPLFSLSGRPLWEITLSQAFKSKMLSNVIVAYDDPRFLDKLGSWQEKVVLCERPPYLSEQEASIMDVLAFTAKEADQSGYGSDYYMLIEITHPLRPDGIIDQMVGALEDLDVDSLITCRRSHYSLWRRDGRGATTRILGPYEKEETELFQELIGICSVFKGRCLRSGVPFGEKVDIVPIDKFWATIDVRDEDGLWLAESYLSRFGIDI